MSLAISANFLLSFSSLKRRNTYICICVFFFILHPKIQTTNCNKPCRRFVGMNVICKGNCALFLGRKYLHQLITSDPLAKAAGYQLIQHSSAVLSTLLLDTHLTEFVVRTDSTSPDRASAATATVSRPGQGSRLTDHFGSVLHYPSPFIQRGLLILLDHPPIPFRSQNFARLHKYVFLSRSTFVDENMKSLF